MLLLLKDVSLMFGPDLVVHMDDRDRQSQSLGLNEKGMKIRVCISAKVYECLCESLHGFGDLDH